jgi:biopolymer transport protein ExbD
MMLSNSVVKDTALSGVLAESSVLSQKAGGGREKKSIVTDLLLTALVDAFSILVIFLLMSFSSTGEILSLGKGQELPKAAKADTIERHPLVKVDEGKYFIEDKEVPAEGLVGELLNVRKAWQEMHAGQEFPGILMVQAHRRVKYEILNSVVLASSHAGFSDIKFAVIMK